jgi:hypothetical protein
MRCTDDLQRMQIVVKSKSGREMQVVVVELMFHPPGEEAGEKEETTQE